MADSFLAQVRRLARELAPASSMPHALVCEATSTFAGAPVRVLPADEAGPAVVVLGALPAESDDGGLAAMSPREREVAALVAQGMTNAAIAARLYVSVATVKDHVHRGLAKTGCRSRTELAARWIRAHGSAGA